MTKTLPPAVAEEIAAQRAHLDAIACERAADDIGSPDVDPARWRSRERDRQALEAAAADRIAELRREVANADAARNALPVVDDGRCATCGRRTTPGAEAVRHDGVCCRTCVDLDEAQRALHRSARAVPADKLPGWLDALPGRDFSELQHLVGGGPRGNDRMRVELAQAARRRRQRNAADGGFALQRRRLRRVVDRSGETSTPAARAGWQTINDALRSNVGATEHLTIPEMRAALDALDRAQLAAVDQLAGSLRDHQAQSVIAAERTRRRTRGPGVGPDAA